MKKKRFFLILLSISILYSCGYKVYTKTDLPLKELYLRVNNLTLEPGLQDRMRKIAYQTLTENGFSITPSANRVLDIQIKNYRLVTLSEIGLNTVEYQIVMDVRAILYDEKGIKIKEFTPSSPFMTFFRTTRDLQSIIAQRDLAIESLMRDICDDMVRKLIFHLN